MTLRSVLSLVAGFALLTPAAVRGEDFTPVYVAVPIKDVKVAAGTTQSTVKLKKTFGLTGVSGQVMRFSTTVGDIDVGLLAKEAPNTVAAFTTYASNPAENGTGAGPSYRSTLIQRAVENFIVQGGGFYVKDDQLNQINDRPKLASEAGVSNLRGTLSMALSSGPDSGTGDWFFNVANNDASSPINNLDGSAGGGPFTVFGKVVAGMPVVDSIVQYALPVNTHHFASPFENVPLVNYDGSQSPTYTNLVYLNDIKPLPLVPKSEGGLAVLKLKAKSSDRSLVNATVVGPKIVLDYVAGKTGTTTVVVTATNPATKSKTKAKFQVTVE